MACPGLALFSMGRRMASTGFWVPWPVSFLLCERLHRVDCRLSPIQWPVLPFRTAYQQGSCCQWVLRMAVFLAMVLVEIDGWVLRRVFVRRGTLRPSLAGMVFNLKRWGDKSREAVSHRHSASAPNNNRRFPLK